MLPSESSAVPERPSAGRGGANIRGASAPSLNTPSLNTVGVNAARENASSADVAWADVSGADVSVAGVSGAGVSGVEGAQAGSVQAAGARELRATMELRAVITDWGGVLTAPIKDMVRLWIEADQIDWDTYIAAVTPWLTGAYQGDGEGVAGANPVHLLERGECTVTEFEEILAARLIRTDGGPVNSDGLLRRMLAAGETPVAAMYEVIRTLRGKGLRTALLSNSWGNEGYPREDFPGLFDAVVISGEVGMRKPEPRIFYHAAELLGVPPENCVFIDDVQANVDSAIACGMIGIRHQDPVLTVATLTELFASR